MSYRENAAPPIDGTAVEIARVREDAETKRLIGKERELTKRIAVEKYGHITRTGAVVVLSLAIVAAALVVLVRDERRTSKTTSCVEMVEVLTRHDSGRECPNGGSIRTTDLPGEVQTILWQCVCPPLPASPQAQDGGP